jgi:DNA polymerase III subunit gamma/tau
LARLLCLYCNCQAPVDHEPCGQCDSCAAMLQAIVGEGQHPDLEEKNAADERGIDMIRALISSARYKPRYNYRVIVLDEAHALTDQAFQASLKLFEEPPSKHSIFVLCTTNPEKLPSTIMSRCAVVRLQDVPVVDTARLLLRVARQEVKALPKKAALQIAEAAHGHPREALTLLQQVFATFDGREIVVEELPAVIEVADVVAPYLAVQRWLSAVLAGKYGNALLALQRSPSMEYFSKAAIETLRMVLHGWIAPDQLVDKSKFWMLKEVRVPSAKIGLAHLDLWVEVLGILVEAQERLKRYQVEASAVMELATYQIVGKVKAAHGVVADA